MKRRQIEKQFLEQIEKVPNISLACEKLGISRNTVYRWRKQDLGFNEKLNCALASGVMSVSDLAESKLISLINQGSFRAITYWLGHNSDRYVKPSLKEFRALKQLPAPIEVIEFYDADEHPYIIAKREKKEVIEALPPPKPPKLPPRT